jgi:hypothetical protein
VTALYTRGEVLWLLSITYEEAVDLDAMPRDSCAGLSDTGAAPTPLDASPLMVVLRWIDVHAARRAILSTKLERMVLRLRAEGFTEREIAAIITTPKTTVRRRFDATITELVRLLGEGPPSHDPIPMRASCLTCGQAPRVRLDPVLRKRKGKWRVIRGGEGRLARVCADCLREELTSRIAA